MTASCALPQPTTPRRRRGQRSGLVELIAIIAVVLHFFQPARLILISANMSNFGALIFPFMLICMNSKLPRAAGPKGWVYLVLVLNFLFFGFFFLNFVWKEVTGDALVQF